jgi:hypothetical protein
MRRGEADAGALGNGDRCDVVGRSIDGADRIEQIGESRAEPRFDARHLALNGPAVGEPDHAARGFLSSKLNKGIEHAAGNPKRDTGDADRIHRLLREGVERPALATQGRILTGRTVGLRHKQVRDLIRFGGRAAQADRVPVVEQGYGFRREEPAADRRVAIGVPPQ